MKRTQLNKVYTTISKIELKTLLTKQLKLVDENLELRKDIEFRDYRIQKLEEELLKMKQFIISNHQKGKMKPEEKIVHKMVNIYV